MQFLVALIALILDRFLDLPDHVWGRLGHPVVWMGRLISALERRLNTPDFSERERRRNGVLMLQVLIVLSLLAAMLLHNLLRMLPLSWLLEAAVASVFLAHRDLVQAVRNVADAFHNSIDSARRAVSHIVGRDVSQLNEAEISRAAIESLAENSSDGLIAPLFWLCLFGLPGIVVYKAINTADSMVGHKSERYLQFGWASARLDDWVNWIPARLTGLLYVAACMFSHRADPRDAWTAMRRDAPHHVSPNAGWPEAAMAGALDFGLGGPRAYQGQRLDLPQMGDGRRDLDASDIRLAVGLFERMANIATALVVLMLFFFF